MIDTWVLPRRFSAGLLAWFFVLALSFATLHCDAACPSKDPAQTSAELKGAEQLRFQSALSAMQAGNPSQAETSLKALHGRYPQNFAINEALGLLYASESRPAEAVPLLQQAAKSCPRSSIAHANLGVAYLKLHDAEGAAKELAEASELGPGNAQTAEALGEAQMLLKHWNRAGAAFSAALAVDPKNQDLLYNAALAYFNAGRYDRARTLLGSVAEIGSSASVQSLLGDVEEKLGNYREAAQHYVSAATLDPSEENIYLLGVEFLRHWTFAPAIEDFSAGVQRFVDSRRMQFGLAIAYYGNENYDLAIEALGKLLALEPDSSMYAELLGRACTAPNEAANPACNALTRFAQLHPRDAAVAVYAVTNLLHRPFGQQDLDTAGKLLDAAVAANPRLPEARFEMGALLQTESKWKESVAPLEAAIQLKPDYAAAHYRLARAYARLGQAAQAKREADQYELDNKKSEADLDARMNEITTLVTKIE